jgi:hypothetical protein
MIYKQFGKTLIVTHETTVYTMTGDQEQRKEVIELVEKFENSKSEKARKTLLNKIVPKLKVKEELAKQELEKKVTKLKAEKKLEKKKTKTESKSKVDSKEMQLAASIENDLKSDEVQVLEDINKELVEENKRLKEQIEKAAAIKPAPATTGVSRRGEY